MKHMLLSTAAVSIALAIPALAHADEPGWYLRGKYLRGNAGYGTHTDIDITGDVVGDVESEGNATASVGVGYEFGNNWRLELDAAQLFTNLGAVSQFPNSTAKLETTTGFLNAIYDFNDFGRWEPYVGAGVGLVRGNATVTQMFLRLSVLAWPALSKTVTRDWVGSSSLGLVIRSLKI